MVHLLADAREHSRIIIVFKLVLRIAVRVLLPLALLAVLMVAVVAGGVFFCTSDLPDTQSMNSFAPVAPTTIVDTNICGEKAIVKALPTSQMMDIRNALLAAEGDVDERSLLRRLYETLLGGPEEHKHYGAYSLQICRQLVCDDHRRALKRELWELRSSVQLSAALQQINYWISTLIGRISARVSTVSRALRSAT
jgi:membrane carboxypeptidase/penicillin-binding protein